MRFDSKSLIAAATTVLLSLPIGQWVSLVVVPMALVIYQLAVSQGIPARILSSPSLLLLGGASYAVYLLQYPVRSWTKAIFSLGGASFSVIGIVLSPLILILFSIVVYRYCEEPIRKFLHPRRR